MAVAVTAGFGWLLSGALFAGLSRFSPLPASLARMVVPETVTASSWSTAMPWPVMVPLLSALTLFGLVQLMVGLFVPRTAPDHPGNRAVMGAVWLCVVLASFLTSALWSAGSILAQWPPPRASLLFEGTGPAFLAAGYWGILWGWIPALVGQRVAGNADHNGGIGNADHGTATLGGRRAWGALTAATALCAVLLVAAAPLSGAATRAASQAKARPAPSPSATAPPVVYGSPTVGPSLQAPDPGWCRGDQVSISLGEPDAATGHRGMAIRLVNTSPTSCVLNAYPDIAFNDTDGWAMDVLTVRGGSFMTTDTGPRPVTVAPGAAAQAALGWNAMAGAGDTRVGTILVSPFPGAVRTALPADLDVVSGGYVAVTAWSLAKPAG